jgi:hypothetical protein
MGRHWDVADATLVQASGLVSIAFVVGLAAVIWIIAGPFGPANWSYQRVLTFLTLAAPPAAVYAIPVERMFAPEIAQHLNLAFMVFVSLWRLSLLLFFLTRLGRLPLARAVVATLLPVSIVVAGLTGLRLEDATFRAMVGLTIDQPLTSASAAAAWAASRGFSLLLLPLMASYLWWNRRSAVRLQSPNP